jgi:hypothetical protein
MNAPFVTRNSLAPSPESSGELNKQYTITILMKRK